MVLEAVVLVLFPAVMAFAAASDLLTMTISNKVSLTLVAGFALVAALSGMSLEQVGIHVGSAALVLVVSFVFFARGWIGGGDAKLAAATALWFGWALLLDYVLYASILGGFLTLALLQLRRHPLPAVLARQPWVIRLHKTDGGIPYGIALAAAALLVYPHTSWMKALAA